MTASSELVAQVRSFSRWNPKKKTIPSKSKVPAYWIPPVGSSMKLNVDCSWVDSDKPSSIAGILRNSKGIVVDGFAKDVLASTPLQAEALALVQGLLFLKQRTEMHVAEGQVQKVQWECESDSSSLVEMVLGREEPPWALRNILIECNNLLSQQVSAKLSHCPREANQAVDW
ncbi:hypothetical protein NL676_012985, partial [Syzygium grande]